MKAEIHPTYEKAVVTCACGNTFETRSTMPEIKVEICAACHPFYTGKQKLIDTAGRVDRFREREQVSSQLREAEATRAEKRALRDAAREAEAADQAS